MLQYAERSVTYKNSILYYYVAGSGSQPMIAFHGFGQDHHAFDSWVQTLGDHYTFYFFDVYFHGKSSWDQELGSLSAERWSKIFSLFLEQQTIERLALAGFSLGGKFVLATLMAFPGRIDRVFLLAPDGIKINFWYRLATYPWLLRRAFNSMVYNKKMFRNLITVAFRLRLIDKWLSKFVDSQMDTEEKRRKVYNSWVTFRHLNTSVDEAAKTILSYGIFLMVITGKHDRVISTREMRPLMRHFPKTAFVELETGHTQLIPASATLLLRNEFDKKI